MLLLSATLIQLSSPPKSIANLYFVTQRAALSIGDVIIILPQQFFFSSLWPNVSTTTSVDLPFTSLLRSGDTTAASPTEKVSLECVCVCSSFSSDFDLDNSDLPSPPDALSNSMPLPLSLHFSYSPNTNPFFRQEQDLSPYLLLFKSPNISICLETYYV